MYKLLIYCFVFLITALFSACQPESFLNDTSAKLSFSNDTIMFDTVFTTISSATRYLKVYNKYNKPVNISSITLAGGKSSNFSIIIDGRTGPTASNIEIQAKDSAYIMVKVNIDPTQKDAPLLILDSIIFRFNDNVQNVKLAAWGQDVHLLKDSVIKTQTWTNDKPYLIYEGVLIDSSAILTIEQGTTIYFHNNAWLIADGDIIVNGTPEKPVIFRGDRLDKIGYSTPVPYDKTPGQWNGILVRNSSNNSKLTYAEIRNSICGLYVGNLGKPGMASVELTNCIIQNNSYSGLFAVNAKIKAYNTLIANNGYYNFFAVAGGEYEFEQCTFASYALFGTSDRVSVVLTNQINDTIWYYSDLKSATFGNCIIYGNSSVELGFDHDSNHQFNYLFDHCLIKDANNSLDFADQSKFKNTIRSGVDDPGFISLVQYSFDFRLTKKSIAVDAGNPNIGNLYPVDYYIHNRMADGSPDLGYAEYYSAAK